MKKSQLIFTTFTIALCVLVGCGKKSASSFPPTDGDFVRNVEGRGTAQVWGINFDVAEPVGSAAASQFEGGLHSDPEQTNARITTTIGDDVSFLLEKVPGSPIKFQLNGKEYGALDSGDKVVIDKKRDVTVNGTPRKPDTAKP